MSIEQAREAAITATIDYDLASTPKSLAGIRAALDRLITAAQAAMPCICGWEHAEPGCRIVSYPQRGSCPSCRARRKRDALIADGRPQAAG